MESWKKDVLALVLFMAVCLGLILIFGTAGYIFMIAGLAGMALGFLAA